MVTYDPDNNNFYGFDENPSSSQEAYENITDIGSEFVSGLVCALNISVNKKWFKPGVSADENSNGYISIKEAFDYSEKWDAAYLYEIPQIDSGTSISTSNFYLW